ncbi:MAG: tetratricopeptide repeat protein [Methylococcaceae bacterium]
MLDLAQPDHISVLYLQLLVNIDPDDASLRLELARQHAKMGKIKEARLVLEPFLNQQGREAIEARFLSLELDLKLYFGKTATDPSRENDLADLRKNIGIIADELVPVDFLPLAIQRSQELGRPDIAAKLYERWAAIDNEHRLYLLKEAGRWYIAAGTPMQAAEIYKKVCASSSNAELAKQFALLAINAFRAADKGPLALAFIREYLQRFPNDVALLDEAMVLSLAENEPKQALAWGNLRLALDPNNPEQISKQIDIALAAGAVDVAWLLSEHLLLLKPQERHLRERTAQIAEWAVKLDVALNHWVWLVRHDKTNKVAIDNALRLARGLKVREITIEMFTTVSGIRALTEVELNDLVAVFGMDGHSASVISFLQRYLTRYPSEQQGWNVLANTQENAGLLLEAIATWHHIGGHFDHPISAVIREAELLLRTGKPEAAFSILLQNQKRASVKDTLFWSLFADSSWECKRNDIALSVYRIIWKSGDKNALAAERLIQLMRDKGQALDASAIATEAYRRLSQPRWLLLAMDVAVQFRLWDDLRQMLHLAEADKQQFQRLEMYWLIRAQVYGHDLQFQQALTAYQQALHVNPAGKIAKESILWILLDQQNNQRLASFLQLWQKDAVTTPSLWGVYALGLSQLGKEERALQWFERKAKLNHDDSVGLLAYADTLTKAGRVDVAQRLRQYVLFKMRTQLQSANIR